MLADAKRITIRLSDHWRLPALAACAFLAGSLVLADSRPALTPTLVFDIAEQPLSNALEAYSAASGVAVLYESDVGTHHVSVAVKGEFSRESALRQLLGNTSLVPRFSRADAVILADPSAVDPDEPPADLQRQADMELDTLLVEGNSAKRTDQSAITAYISAIQIDIQEALRKSMVARGNGFRVGLDIWVDASNAVTRTEVFRSTGNPQRDGAVMSALQGIRFRQNAPADTPRPVRVMIVATTM